MNNEVIKVGVGGIIIKNRKTLLTKRKSKLGNGRYGSVGGHLEFGETPMEALIREAKEELGIELHKIEFLVCSNLLMYNKHYIDITFTAEIKSGTPKIMEPDNHESFGWFDLDNLPNSLFEPVAVAIEALKNKIKYIEINNKL